MRSTSHGSAPGNNWHGFCTRVAYIGTGLGLVAQLTLVVNLQQTLDLRIDRQAVTIQDLAHLPAGEYLKPATLGYHHLGADVLWLQMLQVLGKRQNSADEYSWLYHTLDVITTLDPQYVYAYYVGGVVLSDLGGRVDLSNSLLEKGYAANPNDWSLPFLLGYNHYFILGDAVSGADYTGRASRIPGSPGFLPGLATRMYSESGDPDTALQFLEELWKRNPDVAIREKLEVRAKEVIIERDIRSLESVIQQYRDKQGHYPSSLQELVVGRYLPQLPQEPFGGSYILDPRSGKVTSSTHPDRLKVFRLDKQGGV